MKSFLAIFIGLATSLTIANSFASEASERMYLIQILNQLNAMQPLIFEAQKAQPKNARIQFHYTSYHDNQGNLQNGLLEDIQAIKQGIQQMLNQPSIEPRVVAPIKGDYLSVTIKSN